MVYRGKPSPACQLCRQRRIKCDLLRPGCTQCANARTECPGYRDILALSFLDESESVVRKAKSKQRKKDKSVSSSEDKDGESTSSGSSRGSRSPREPGTSDDIPDVSNNQDGSAPVDVVDDLFLDLLIPPQLEVALDVVATNFFMASYATESRYDYLPRIFSHVDLDSPLMLVVQATAIANFARETQDMSVLPAARSFYVQGLAKTNAALRTPSMAVQDESLISVMLLGLYESIMQEGRQSPVRWTAHARGAVALLYERGTKQFTTELGRTLFLQVSETIRASCAQQAIPMPKSFLDLERRALPYFDEGDPIVHLNIISDEFAELRAAGAWGNWGNTDLVRKLMRLDYKFAAALNALPKKYDCDVHVIATASSHVFGLTAHEFPDHHIAKVWNTARMMRFFLNSAVIHHTRKLLSQTNIQLDEESFEEWTTVQQNAQRKLVEISEAILASVPQFTRQRPDGSVFFIGAASLVWPLASIGESSLTSETMRGFVVEQLRYLGKQARVPQAFWAADMVEERTALEDWIHLSHSI